MAKKYRYATEGNVRVLINLIKEKFSDYLTDEQIEDAITDAVSSVASLEFKKVDALPQVGESKFIYLVPNAGSNPNVYDEYFWSASDGTFELFGTTQMDLSGYVTNEELEAKDYLTDSNFESITDTEINQMWSSIMSGNES